MHLLGCLSLHQDLFFMMGSAGIALVICGWIGFAFCAQRSGSWSAESHVVLGDELIQSSDGEQMAKCIYFTLFAAAAAQGTSLASECASAGFFCIESCIVSPVFDTNIPFEVGEIPQCAPKSTDLTFQRHLAAADIKSLDECVTYCLNEFGQDKLFVEYGTRSGTGLGACNCVRGVCDPMAAGTMIAAVDGTDFGAAGGEAMFSNGWVEFPGPPSTNGGHRAGHIAFAFSCAAPSTVAWELSAVRTDGNSDSVMVGVENPSERVAWHLQGSRSTLEDMEFTWSSRSTSFAVDAGPNSLLISEREVRHLVAAAPLLASIESTQVALSAARFFQSLTTSVCAARRMACILTVSALSLEVTSVRSMPVQPRSSRVVSRCTRPMPYVGPLVMPACVRSVDGLWNFYL